MIQLIYKQPQQNPIHFIQITQQNVGVIHKPQKQSSPSPFMYSTIRTTSTLSHPFRSHPFKSTPHHQSFQQFYSTSSKSFSIIQNLKNLKTPQHNFIDKDFIDAIDEKNSKKRMSELIKRKVPMKMKTEQIEILHSEDKQGDNKRHLKIFSQVFNKERQKVLSKFESSKQMRETVFKKLGLKKPNPKPFFAMERKHIHSFQNRHIQQFRKYNTKERHKKPVKRVHPLCDIYQKQAKRVIKNHSFEKKEKVEYEPFGKIDYSAHYF